MTDAIYGGTPLTRLIAACRERGIAGPEEFQRRYGVPPDSIQVDEALDLVQRPDRARAHNRSTWTPHQRRNYVAGSLRALEAMKARLERGLAYLEARYSVTAEVHWFRLATRSTRLIGKLSRASTDAGQAFTESELGRWYAALKWPKPSEAALHEDWDTSVRHPARAA